MFVIRLWGQLSAKLPPKQTCCQVPWKIGKHPADHIITVNFSILKRVLAYYRVGGSKQKKRELVVREGLEPSTPAL